LKVNLENISRFSLIARVLLFVLLLLLFWLPFAIPISLWFAKDPNLVAILTMSLLGLEFLLLLNLWSKFIYNIPNGFQYYGWEWTFSNLNNLLKGLSIGFLFCISLFIVESLFGWLDIKSDSSGNLAIVVAQGLFSALAVAFFEELFFRGWLLKELEKNYSQLSSLLVDSLIFATLHFIKPLAAVVKTFPQFPALFLLGVILVWAKRSSRDRLGLPMGIHAGLVWGYYILNVGQLLSYKPDVPDWLTGINHNPLSGVMGLLFLTLLAQIMQKKSKFPY